MLPYFQYNSILIGPVVIQVWGLMVALGIIAAVLLMIALSKKYLLSKEVFLDLSVWILLAGFIGARAFHIVFYNLDYYLAHPLDTLKFWQGGASSLGGLFGAAVAVWLFVKLRQFSWAEFLPYLDIVFFSLWFGWAIGRLGCFFIHDHPGKLSTFFLAINFPNGARHDLGLYDALVSLVIFFLTAIFFKHLIKLRWGLVSAFSLAFYATARFLLDFLRATDLPESDIRYGGLTPAQWGMLTVILVLTSLLVWGKMRRTKKS